MSHSEQIKILLVDDRPENLLAYRAILSELDLDLRFAASGEEALKTVLVHDFAVILLDVNMPGIDGFETASLIRGRKQSAHTPIIFLTAFPDEVHAARGYAHGAVDYLQTPIVPEVLRAKVKVFVDLFRMTEQIKRQGEERLAFDHERMRRNAAEEANSRLRFLARVTEVVGRTLDYDVTARDLVRLTVPTLGDDAVVARWDEAARSGWHVVQAVAIDGRVSVVELTSLDSLPAEFADAIRQSQSQQSPTACRPFQAAPGDSDPRLILLPLAAQKSTFAVLGITREPAARPFNADDLTLAEALASRASMALENARLYNDLERADRQKNEFLSMLAHELRNPLAPIRTAVDVLRLKDDGHPEIEWAREIINRQTSHLVRLVDDLLDVSRITGGKIRLDLEVLDVAAVVSAAVETSRPLIKESGHEMCVSLPDEPLWVRCDRVRLAQVLANLLNNAAKYTQAGGLIQLEVQRAGTDAVFRICDNGIGISPEMLPKVFDLFSQSERSIDRSQGGLGVGLTVVKRLVEMHGGRVDAASNGPGTGSEFTVRLPALDAPPEAQVVADSTTESRSPEVPLRVLVVDDNADAAESLAYLLKHRNHEVRTAHDGRLAVKLAREFRPQAVVLDLGLPEIDGYQVARQLRQCEATRGALLVALSGYGQQEHRRRSSEAGFDYHFVKPLDFGALQRILLEANDRPRGELARVGSNGNGADSKSPLRK
jgi:signal transduction histidine kinase/FixJ family two-component response regulator